jgi:plastocyanin domain-containing protein
VRVRRIVSGVPQNTNAKANTPTVLKVNTQGTFDCSASLVIPDLGYKQFLPPQGTTEITIPPQKPGTSLTGVCSMGMYNFTINFN